MLLLLEILLAGAAAIAYQSTSLQVSVDSYGANSQSMSLSGDWTELVLLVEIYSACEASIQELFDYTRVPEY